MHRPSATNKNKFINIYIYISSLCLSLFSFPTIAIMPFSCSFCPKNFASESQHSQHVSTCSKKTSCFVTLPPTDITLPSRSVKAYRNSSNQWPCYCDTSQCQKIYSCSSTLQQHLRRHAGPDTQWKVCFM